MSSFLSGLTIGSALLGLALIIIVALYLLRPFVMHEDEEKRASREEIDALLLRKESLLRDIRELDDDYESAKVAPEMYNAARPQMLRQAALIMKQLDDHGYTERGATAGAGTADIDAQIEAAVRRVRTPEQLDEQMEAAIRRARNKPAASGNGTMHYCPQCGRPVDPEDRFCPRCGQTLVQESTPAQITRA